MEANQKILDESVKKDHFHTASLQFEQCIDTIHVHIVLSCCCVLKKCYISIENITSIKWQYLKSNASLHFNTSIHLQYAIQSYWKTFLKHSIFYFMNFMNALLQFDYHSYNSDYRQLALLILSSGTICTMQITKCCTKCRYVCNHVLYVWNAYMKSNNSILLSLPSSCF